MNKIIVLALPLVLFVGCINQRKNYTEEESLEIARKFVLDCPTYKFDGEDLKHVDTVQARCPSCWVFTFEFTSRSAGYGDRAGQMVAQVITQHTATIAVEQGRVTRAVLDDQWDMINQQMIEEQT